jgi:hypothetical protein
MPIECHLMFLTNFIKISVNKIQIASMGITNKNGVGNIEIKKIWSVTMLSSTNFSGALETNSNSLALVIDSS